MKKSSKILSSLLVLILCFISIFTLASCAEGNNTFDILLSNSSIEQSIVKSYDYETYKGKSLYDFLKSQKELKAVINEDNPSMPYLVSINGYELESNQFIAIYTTNISDQLVGMTPIEYKGKQYYSAKVGIKDLKIIENVNYAFIVTTFEMPNVNTPIISDVRLNGVVNVLKEGITPVAEKAENINAITRAGYDLGDSFYNDFKTNFAQYMLQNGDGANLKIVENSIQVLLYKGLEVPKEVIDFINRDKWSRGFSVRFSVGIILPAVTELANAGYDINKDIEQKLVGELLATIENDVITTPWGLDDVAVTAIALAPYAKDNEKIKTILENTAKDLVLKITDKVYDNICTISYILRMCVEFDYYSIAHELDEKKMYDSIINKQDETGNIGQIFENVQGLQGLLSYQRYYNGDGGTYFRVAKNNL